MRRSFLVRMAQHWPRLRPGWPHHPHPLEIQLGPIAQWFHAVSDATRIDILEFLSQRERSAGELCRIIGVPPSRVSYHLKLLREAGLIRMSRDGRKRFYALNGETLNGMVEFVRTVLPGAHVGTCPLPSCQRRPGP